MSWWGKGLGLAAGYLAGGFLGAALGAALGYSTDKGFKGYAGGLSGEQRRMSAALLEHLFALLGAVAKADGRVSQVEVAWAEKRLQRLRPSRAQRDRLIRAFDAGRRADFDLEARLAALRPLLIRDPALAKAVLQGLIDLARCDGHIHKSQSTLVWRCGMALGVPRAWLQSRMVDFTRSANTSPASDPYQVLGIDADADDGEVKLAYRRLMQRHHPDRLASDCSTETRQAAVRRSAEVRWAWEQLRLARGLR